jgi:hypothetical protein
VEEDRSSYLIFRLLEYSKRRCLGCLLDGLLETVDGVQYADGDDSPFLGTSLQEAVLEHIEFVLGRHIPFRLFPGFRRRHDWCH